MTKSSSVGMAMILSALAGSTGCATYTHRVATLQPFADEGKYLSNIMQLTSGDMGFLNAGEAYFSPDGRTIIFQATPLGKTKYQIYTLDLKTGQTKLISTGKGACTCAYFHPSGEKIIFASTHLDPDADAPEPPHEPGDYAWRFHKHMDIFEADLDGSNLRRLTDTPGYDAEGSYSSDGERIVFVSQRDDDLEIYVMDADGSNQHRITDGKGYDGGPFFSPDGRLILYRGDRRNDGKMDLQLRVVNADGTDDRALTDNQLFNWCPYWYPTGNCLIFTQTDHTAWSRGERPNYDLFMATPKADKFVRITFDPAFDGLPVFSPDGRRLLWSSQRGGVDDTQIFIADFKLPDEFKNLSEPLKHQ